LITVASFPTRHRINPQRLTHVCVSEKFCYPDHEAARVGAERQMLQGMVRPGAHVEPYRCPLCGHWHTKNRQIVPVDQSQRMAGDTMRLSDDDVEHSGRASRRTARKAMECALRTPCTECGRRITSLDDRVVRQARGVAYVFHAGCARAGAIRKRAGLTRPEQRVPTNPALAALWQQIQAARAWTPHR
jgi:hypothetical protein